MTHGTVTGYVHHGCRCDACKLAASRYYYKQTRAERYAIPPAHGTEARYVHHRCRCDECKRASREARARRRLRFASDESNVLRRG